MVVRMPERTVDGDVERPRLTLQWMLRAARGPLGAAALCALLWASACAGDGPAGDGPAGDATAQPPAEGTDAEEILRAPRLAGADPAVAPDAPPRPDDEPPGPPQLAGPRPRPRPVPARNAPMVPEIPRPGIAIRPTTRACRTSRATPSTAPTWRMS